MNPSAIALALFGCSSAPPSDTDVAGDSDVTVDSDVTGDSDVSDEILVDVLPGSHNHSPDGTWWGYNMTKIARFGDRVFTYVIVNDDDPAIPSEFVVLMKTADEPWTEGASFTTSRPGNLVVDSAGALHAFVFEATDLQSNDSIGRLMHYTLPDAGDGDIETVESEIVIDNDGSKETVNIRVGTAIGADDTLVVAFGLTDWSDPEVAESEQVYVRGSGETTWTRHLAGTNLGHDYYYPFVSVSENGIGVLPIQDDYVAPDESNIYQIIPFFGFDGDSWSQHVLVDLTDHELASSQPRLLEQSDLFEDSSGTLHVIYKEFLGDTSYEVSAFQHWARAPGGDWVQSTYAFPSEGLNWLKMVEVEGELFFLGVSWNVFYAMPVGGEPQRIVVPGMITGAYPTVAGPRSGTLPGPWVDVLLLNGDSGNYPDADNLYVRIPTSVLTDL